MESHSSSLQYKVGLFIGAGLLLGMISILLLGGDKAIFTRYIRIQTRFSEVQGLFPGSVVSLAGVPVGNIESIAFVSDTNALNVVMKINQSFRDKLVEGTKAEIRTQGALGDKYVYLKPGAADAKHLENNAVIDGIETDYMKMITDREDGAARIIDLIKEMHVLVANLNGNGRSAEVSRNLSEASAKLNSTLTSLDALLGEMRGQLPPDKKLRNALVSLSNIMEKIDQGKGTLGQLINDPSVHQNLKAFLGGSPRNQYMKTMIRETIQKSDVGSRANDAND